MKTPTPLNRYRQRGLDSIARCPSCGAWTYWPDIAAYVIAELDPTHCHHGTNTESRTAA